MSVFNLGGGVWIDGVLWSHPAAYARWYTEVYLEWPRAQIADALFGWLP